MKKRPEQKKIYPSVSVHARDWSRRKDLWKKKQIFPEIPIGGRPAARNEEGKHSIKALDLNWSFRLLLLGWLKTQLTGFCNCSMFCCALLCAYSSFAIMGKKELVALLCLSSSCFLIVVWLFLTPAPWIRLQFVIVVFHDHTHFFYRHLTSDLDSDISTSNHKDLNNLSAEFAETEQPSIDQDASVEVEGKCLPQGRRRRSGRTASAAPLFWTSMLSAVSLFSRFGSFFFVLTSDFQFIDAIINNARCACHP